MSIIYTVVDILFSAFMWLLLTPGAFYAACTFSTVIGISALVAGYKYDFWKIGRVV